MNISDIIGPKYSVVPDAEGRSDLDSPWFIFNDFAVQNVSEREALSFPDKWKVCLVERRSIEPTQRHADSSNRVSRTSRRARKP